MKYRDLLKDKNLLEKEVPTEILKMLGLEKKKVFEIGEQYYYISAAGVISTNKWDNDYADLYRLKHNNAFHTKEEAEFEFEKQKTLAELREFAEENNTEEFDWEDDNQDKWYIAFNWFDEKLQVTYINNQQDINGIYFTSRELTEQAVKTVGEDRIKKYLFGVENE